MAQQISRRQVFLGVVGVGGLGLAAWNLGGQNLFYAALTPDLTGGVLAADQAHQMALAGEVLLIDIRRPDEWAATGSPEGSVQLDMQREDFDLALAALQIERPDVPVAVICMRGVRSARLTNRLIAAGFNDIRDVSEGMLGSAAGPGWVRRGLPVYGRG